MADNTEDVKPSVNTEKEETKDQKTNIKTGIKAGPDILN
jgi:hypothetical protein